MRTRWLICAGLGLAAAGLGAIALAGDQPQWGQRHTRNMVSAETGLPITFDPGERNQQTGQIEQPPQSGVRWVAKLGGQAYGTPIVAGGRVLVGTNNEVPRDPRIEGDRGVLMCFDEHSGEFLWQLVVPKLLEIKWSDWQYIGITSPPTVEGDRAWLVSNRCEVLCLDLKGMADGNDGPFLDEGRHMVPRGEAPLEPTDRDADILWVFDMNAELNVEPHNGANCSVLIDGDRLYVCTSNGVEWTHKYVVHPEAPSLIVLDKNTGQLLAQDDFGIGGDVTHGQWSSPAMGEVGGRRMGFFGAGNGVLYAFEALDPQQRPSADPLRIQPVWRFHGHPLAQTQDRVPPDHQHDSTSYQVTANPVFYKERIYLIFTQECFHGMKQGWLVCLDATGTGDVTRSAIRWSYDEIGSSPATVAIADGLVYAAGFDGRLHCLDAETGKVYWVHEVGKPIWGSPLVADGKVYLGTGGNALCVLRAGKQLEEISRIRMRDGIFCSVTAANGTLFVATRKHLYAVGSHHEEPGRNY